MGARRVSQVIASLTALVIGVPVVGAAQRAAPATWQATPASVLKSALRSTAAAQSRYRDAKGSVAPLALRLEPGVRVEILRAGTVGWQGRATHIAQPGRSCVVFVGSLEGAEAPRTDGDREMAGEDGIPLCDRMR